MNYLFEAFNLVCLLWSIYRIITLQIQGSNALKIIGPAPRGERDERTKNRFYTDYFYTTGIIYAMLCGALFLGNCIAILFNWQDFQMADAKVIGKFLADRQNYYYFLAATGLTIAFLILPDRTSKLQDAQDSYVILSVIWLFIALLSVSLPQ